MEVFLRYVLVVGIFAALIGFLGFVIEVRCKSFLLRHNWLLALLAVTTVAAVAIAIICGVVWFGSGILGFAGPSARGRDMYGVY